MYCLARRLCPVLSFLCLLCGCLPLMGADIKLSWDANAETNIAGYRIYFGTAPRVYGSPITLGNQTAYTLTGLNAGTYYLTVTAFDISGNESSFSNEVTQTLSASTVTCDINNDGGVNVLDLQALINAIMGLNVLSGIFDLNRDGKVDVLDLQILANVILGLRTCPQ